MTKHPSIAFALIGLYMGVLTDVHAQTTVTIPEDTQTTTTSYSYFDSGLLKSETIEPDAAAGIKLVTQHEYDRGNRTQTTLTGRNADADESRATKTGWDTAGRFPTSTTNAKGHKEERDYDPRFGSVTRYSDANGVTTRWEYDSFGRKTRERRGYADKTTGSYTDVTEWSYELCTAVGCNSVDGVAPVQVVTTRIKSAPGAGGAQTQLAPTTKVYLDRLDRVLRTETESLGSSGSVRLIYQDTHYNSNFGVERTSLPYFAGDTPQWKYFDYDALRRPASETAPNGVRSETLYGVVGTSAKVTTIVHATEGDRTRIAYQNTTGQTIEVVDPNGRSTYFGHDAAGRLTHTVDPYGNTTQSQYDVRGRRKGMSDPDMGNWSYTVNAFGEVTSQTDGKGQVTTQKYDELGRLFKRTEPDIATDFTYDSAAMGVGKLAKVATDNGYCRTHTYDTAGRPSSTTTGIGGTTPCTAPSSANFTSSVSYDSAGRIDTSTYPTGVTLKNSYNAKLGFLEKVGNYTGNAAGATYWQWVESDALGHISQFKQGNGIATLKTYDAQTGLLKGIGSGRGGSPALGDVQLAVYAYDSVGNLSERSDRFDIPYQQEKSGHDALGRLAWYALYDSSSGAEKAGSRVTMVYDAIGNIKSKTDTGTYYYNASGGASVRPHAVAEVRGPMNASYAYADANGNMTGGAGRTIGYTAANLVSSVGNNSTCHRFWYQGEHQRMQQTISSGSCSYTGSLLATTVYVHPDAANGLSFERETKGGVTTYKHYVNAGGMVVGMLSTTSASVTSNTTGSMSYFHYDHLGSVVAVSDASANVVERRSFDPWGKARKVYGASGTGELPNSMNAATDRGFTLHEHLEGAGLVHMNGRVYDFSLGRFVSPDPQVQEPGDLQSYNRFAYVMNRPLNSVDPTGFNSMETGGCWYCFSPSGDLVALPPRLAQAGLGAGGLATLARNGFTTLSQSAAQGSYNNFMPQESTSGLLKSFVQWLGPKEGVDYYAQARAAEAEVQKRLDQTPWYLRGLVDTQQERIAHLYLAGDITQGTGTGKLSEQSTTYLIQEFGQMLGALGGSMAPGGGTGCSCCFVAGTQVLTNEGWQPIENIRVGTLVQARDEKTGATALKPVTALIRNEGREIFGLVLLEASGKSTRLEVSNNHPFWVIGRGWMESSQLRRGMKIATFDKGDVTVVQLEDLKRTALTFNLTVDDFHTFFAGDSGAFVHNAGPACCTSGAPKGTLFRGGNSMRVRLGVDIHAAADGLIHPFGKNGRAQGPSVNLDPTDKNVQRWGGAFPVNSIPSGLQALPDGKPGHFVLAPATPMPLEKYQELLNQVQLGNFNIVK